MHTSETRRVTDRMPPASHTACLACKVCEHRLLFANRSSGPLKLTCSNRPGPETWVTGIAIYTAASHAERWIVQPLSHLLYASSQQSLRASPEERYHVTDRGKASCSPIPRCRTQRPPPLGPIATETSPPVPTHTAFPVLSQ